ncbi:MAG TPA: DUF1549 and DUF1553 domain-containing protein [Gemmataceae bacterium]|nr:DUF1549 and DUF1553 domain-containing protein [Gemmataceae bacterium]
MKRFVAILSALMLVQSAFAEDAKKSSPAEIDKMPEPAQVRQLQMHPEGKLKLLGGDDSAQLVVTGVVPNGLQDLTGAVKYEVADGSVARVTDAGRVLPKKNGATRIIARYGAKTASVELVCESMDVDLPINFANHIVPVFTKLGCNGGGCHGKSGGQNGFALSLLGFVPDFDYQTLVKENRGRRLFPAAPEASLLLRKATGAIAHGGGKRMEVGSEEYKLVRRWIASGSPRGSDSDPHVVRISVYPEQRIIGRRNRQQFAVYAHYTDGTVTDVTPRAQYESNDTDIAIVDGAGLVRSQETSGEAAVMARYQAQVATFRATVPLGMKIPEYKFAKNTLVDTYTQKKWQELGLVPSELSSDEHFIRRVTIDITGTLPTPTQVKAFLADTDPLKRDKLIDALVDTPEYAYYFANRWADILRVKRGKDQNQNRASGTFAFHGWIKDAMANDMGYDEFVRQILTAAGDELKSPPTFWYRDLTKPGQFVDDSCQLFLGVRMACAQCHHHPFEKWSQDDYWSMASFFSQIGRKNIPTPGAANQNQNLQRVAIFNKGSGSVTNPRTGKTAEPKSLDGPALKFDSGEDPRARLADWMTSKDNPFFAKAVANRYWAHFFGRGIVDPVDDMRVTNPPTNPELLDALAKDFAEHNFSLKHLVKTIAKSRTYQLSAVPNEFNKHDKKSFARFYPRRLSAEVLYDAVSQVTDAPPAFAGMPSDKHAPNRAIMLPDESYQSYFLDVFGRPQRISACECERVSDANLAQALHLLNSQEIQQKLSRPGGRAAALAKDKRSDTEKVEELFLWALARRPTQPQLDRALSNIEANASNKALAYENIIWALLNAKEFILTQ